MSWFSRLLRYAKMPDSRLKVCQDARFTIKLSPEILFFSMKSFGYYQLNWLFVDLSTKVYFVWPKCNSNYKLNEFGVNFLYSLSLSMVCFSYSLKLNRNFQKFHWSCVKPFCLGSSVLNWASKTLSITSKR